MVVSGLDRSWFGDFTVEGSRKQTRDVSQQLTEKGLVEEFHWAVEDDKQL